MMRKLLLILAFLVPFAAHAQFPRGEEKIHQDTFLIENADSAAVSSAANTSGTTTGALTLSVKRFPTPRNVKCVVTDTDGGITGAKVTVLGFNQYGFRAREEFTKSTTGTATATGKIAWMHVTSASYSITGGTAAACDTIQLTMGKAVGLSTYLSDYGSSPVLSVTETEIQTTTTPTATTSSTARAVLDSNANVVYGTYTLPSLAVNHSVVIRSRGKAWRPQYRTMSEVSF